MLRSPQVVALSCPLRSVFLRERHAAPCSRHSAAAARWPQGRSREGVHGREGGPSLPSLPSPSLRPTQPPALSCDSDDHQRRETSLQRLFSSSVDSSCLQSPGMPTHRTVLGAAAVARRWNPRADRLWAGERQFPSARLSRARAFHAAPREAAAAAWRHCLSPENEERCRQRLAPNLKLYETDRKERRGWIPSKARSQARWASVLVSLCSVAGEPAFLFTLRSCMLKGRHKGDVSFAGGKSDPSDSDVVATALREAREELGVNVSTDSVWGTLKPLRDWSGMMIAPVLANLGPVEELTFEPNPGEVEEIFTLSVSHLCNPQNCGYTHFRTGDKYGYTLPVFRNGKHRVWGLTAVALDHSLKLIVPGPRSK